MRRLLLILLLLRTGVALAQDDKLPFGVDQLATPPQRREITVSPRTIELLSSQWSREPTAAAQADVVRDLGETQSLQALPALFEAIKHPEEIVRAEAARSLGKIKSPECASVLIKAMDDASPLVRREVVIAAAECSAQQAVSRGLSDADESVCLSAIARARAQDAKALMQLIEGTRIRLQIQSIRRLTACGVAVPVELLHKLMLEDSPLAVRIAAIEAMQHQKLPPTQPQLDDLARSNEPELHLATADWVRTCGDVRQRESLAGQLLSNESIAMRAAGLALVQSAPSVKLTQLVLAQMERDDLLLITSAADALLAIATENRESVEKIAGELLVSKDWRVRAQASRMLGMLRSGAAMESHVALLRDTEPRVVEVAVAFLPATQSAAAVDAVASFLAVKVTDVDALRSRDDPMPARIVKAGFLSLGKARAVSALPACKAVISQKAVFPASVRCAAIWASGVIVEPAGSQDMIAACATFADDPLEDESVRLESVKALGNLRAPGTEPAMRALLDSGQTHRLRWLANWALGRVSSAPAFVDVPARVSPDLLLQDIPKQGMTGDVVLNASLVGGYLPDAWSQIRCVIANNSDNAVDGIVRITPHDAPGLPATSTAIQIPAHAQREIIVHAILPEPPTAAEIAARGSAGGVALAELVSTTGAVVARSAIAGQALAGSEDAQQPSILLYLGGNQDAISDPYSLARELGGAIHQQLIARVTDAKSSLSANLGVDRIRVVVAEDVDLDSLSLSERATLLEFIRQGGTVVISGGLITDNWLTAMLPVHSFMARRQVLGDALVEHARLASLDSKVSHEGSSELFSAAVGGGSVVISSLRCSDLARVNDQPRLKAIGKQIRLPSLPELRSNAQREIAGLLPAIAGTPVLSWRIAAGCVIAYGVVTALSLCLAGSIRRPMVFVLLTGLACVVSLVAYFLASGNRSNRKMVLARVQVIDCSTPGRVSKVSEFAAISGTGHEVFQVTSVTGDLRMIGDRISSTILLRPLRVEDVHATAGQIDVVFQAQSNLSVDGACAASVTLDGDDLRLRVDNAMNRTIHSPVLVSNARVYRLPTLDHGASSVSPAKANLPGDFTNPSAVASQVDRLRGEVVKSLCGQSGLDVRDPSMTIIGWIDQAPRHLIEFSPEKFDVEKSHVAVRIPVSVARPASGKPFQIGEQLCVVVFPESGDLRSPGGRGWISTAQTGTWLIRIDFAGGLGAVRPRSVKLRSDLLAPLHQVEWRKGFCPERRLNPEATGESIVTWTHVDESRELQFDCTPADFDDQGRIYLKLSVNCDQVPASAWQMRDISASIIATAEQ
jgi:HEAT repeat protein